MRGSASLAMISYFCAMRFYALVVVALLFSFVTRSQDVIPTAFETVNSTYDEQNPVISPDGKILYVTIAHHPENRGGKKDPGDIWISVKLGDRWSGPIHAGDAINHDGYNAVAGFSDDGNVMYLLGHYEKTGKIKTQGISVSQKTDEGWSFPENITIPYFLNRSEMISGTIINNGSTLVFSADGYNSQGNEDIYVSVLQSTGNWSEPMNLGSSINTGSQEVSPSLSKDTRTLYFASNGRQGYGSFDVYYAERLDGTWTKWTQPVNMGAPINTEGRELFYQPYPEKSVALYTSTLNSDGYGDIKLTVPLAQLKPEETIKKDTVVKMVEIKREKPITTDEKIITVKGKITSAKSHAPIVASLDFHADHNYKVSAQLDGSYSVTIPSVNQYSIRVEAPGFVSSLEKLDVRTYEMKELVLDFNLLPIEVGTTVNLKNVLFYQSTSDLLPESLDELNMVADFLKSNPNVEIDLAGHTDNRGIHSHNVRLSQDRVNKVKRYLVDNGIESKRISGKGYGGIKPIASNDAEVTRQLNRRVEFTIVKN
ncbi:MAG: OmpA family protein [Flammeovirgaceae bacterium]|nr:OmpA family protein [Flammeovirgaceae bacterium]